MRDALKGLRDLGLIWAVLGAAAATSATASLAGCATAPPADSGKTPDKTPTTADKSDKSDDADLADKIKKKEREVEYAKLDLEITKMSAAADEREMKTNLEQAELDLDNARRELDHFASVAKTTSLAKAQLGLERSQWSSENERQELQELENMYKQDELATLTKELVLQRGRMSLKFAERDLTLEQQALRDLTEFELPKQQRELEVKARKAQQDVEAARTKIEKNTIETKLKLLKAQNAVEEAATELAKLQKELASKKQPSPAAAKETK